MTEEIEAVRNDGVGALNDFITVISCVSADRAIIQSDHAAESIVNPPPWVSAKLPLTVELFRVTVAKSL